MTVIHKDLQRFVIVTLPRSGSYHLVSLLDSAQDVQCFGEVFKKHVVELPPPFLTSLGMQRDDMAVRDVDGQGFLEDLFRLQDIPIQGFKAFIEHLDPAGLAVPDDRPDWKYIYLKRNGVSSFVSGKRAEDTGIYVMNDGGSVDPDLRYRPIPINVEKLENWLIWQDKLNERWAAHRDRLGADRVHLVDYEDLRDAARLDEILAFLGSFTTGEELSSRIKRQFNRPFWDGVENAADVQAFLRASKWANLLSDLA